MRIRTIAATTITAVALVSGGATAASAAPLPGSASGTSITTTVVTKAPLASGKSKKAPKPAKVTKVNLGGTVTAVDTAAGTLSFTVKGGKSKALRGTVLTVHVAEGARVRRETAEEVEVSIALGDVVVGEKVRVKGVRAADGTTTVTRVSVEPAS